MTSISVNIVYIFVFSWYQVTTQAQRLPDETASKSLNLSSFLEQLFNLTNTQNNRNEYDSHRYPSSTVSEQVPDIIDPFNMPSHDTLRPTIDSNNWNWDDWDESNRSNLITSTMIAVAIALIVLIKLTLIALMVRRGRRLQRRMTVISSNHTSIPNEFDNDSAHLVTPATIMYVEPQDLHNTTGVHSIPCSSATPGLLMMPPPYSETSDGTAPLLQGGPPKDDYPPPAYQESQDA